MSKPPVAGFRLTPQDLAQLEELRARLQSAVPFKKITKSDAVRYAIATASGSMTPIDVPETITDAPRRRAAGER